MWEAFFLLLCSTGFYSALYLLTLGQLSHLLDLLGEGTGMLHILTVELECPDIPLRTEVQLSLPLKEFNLPELQLGTSKVWLVPSLRLALENYAYLPDKPCVSQEPMDSLLSRVLRLRRADSTAVIIVSLHWGGEHTLEPVPRQRHKRKGWPPSGNHPCRHPSMRALHQYAKASLTYSPKISFSLFCSPWARRPRATILPCGSMSRLSGMLFTP